MANSKSAQKRIKIAKRNAEQNKSYKSAAKTSRRRFFLAIDAYNSNPSSITEGELESLKNKAFSKIDKAIKVGAIPKNRGARQKSQIAKSLPSFSEGVSSSLPGDDSTSYPTREERERRKKPENPSDQRPHDSNNYGPDESSK